MEPLSSAYTLRKKDTYWILTGPNGQVAFDSADDALRQVQSVSPYGGSEVRMLDSVGLIYQVVQVPRASEIPPPAPMPPAPAPAPPPAPHPQPAVGNEIYRLFLQPEANPAPAEIWGSWKVREGFSGTVEVEGTADVAGEHFAVVCYLTADEHNHGVNAFACLGGMLTGAWTHRQELLASPLAQQALVPGGYLAPLLKDGNFDDAGLGRCDLLFFDEGHGLETMLLWRDGQEASLGATPHTRFMVQRTMHIAAVVIAELFLLYQELERAPATPASSTAPPKAKTIWDEADSTLSWLDTNLTRVGNILNVLGEFFDF